MPMPELRDYAAERLPQRFRAPLRGEMPRPCPLSGRLLYCDEGPHAVAWLAERGDTVLLLGTHWHLAGTRYVQAADPAQAERIRCAR